MATAAISESGVIEADKTYTKKTLMRLAEIGEWAFRTAKKNGLRTRVLHGRVIISGSDWLEYCERCATEQATSQVAG